MTHTNTSIQWTDRTWSPTIGCTRINWRSTSGPSFAGITLPGQKLSGCDRCYAFELHDMRYAETIEKGGNPARWPNAPAQYHKPFSQIQLLPQRLTDPLHWRESKRVFVDSMSDLFHPQVTHDFLLQVWAVMALTPKQTYQILTKRPERMRDWISQVDQTAIKVASMKLLEQVSARVADRLRADLPHTWTWPLPNIWLGASVEHQDAADLRIPLLLETPAAIRFLSCEPLLASVDLSPWVRTPMPVTDPDLGALDGALVEGMTRVGMSWERESRLNWVIIGGESGSHARPMELSWARDILGTCKEANISVFVKQLGSVWASAHHARTPRGKPDTHGGEIVNWPAELRIRKFPAIAV